VNWRWWGLFEAGGRFTAVERSGRGKERAPNVQNPAYGLLWGAATHAGLAMAPDYSGVKAGIVVIFRVVG